MAGGMCNAHTLPRGSREEIRAQVAAIMEVAAEGGAIIGSHSVGSDIPVASYLWYRELVRTLGGG